MSTVCATPAASRAVSEDWSQQSVLWPFAALLVALNFHILRNLTPAYLALPIACYGLCLIFYAATALVPPARTLLDGHLRQVQAGYYALMFLFVYLSFISPAWVTPEELITALPRVWFIPLLGLFATRLVLNEKQVRRLLVLYVCLGAIGSLTMPLQIVTGPISWFAESSSRAGMDRYASMFGSLTTIGVVGGLALVAGLLTRLPYAVRLGLIGCIGVGLLCSLQKAAVINLLLTPGVCLFAAGKRWRQNLSVQMRIAAPLLFLGASLALDARFNGYVEYVLVKSGAGDSAEASVAVDDFGIVENTMDRLFGTISEMYEQYGVESVLFGAGVKGLGGNAGLPDYDMAHNTYGDLLFSGGIVTVLAFVYLQYATLRSLFGLRRLARSANAPDVENNVVALLGMTLIYFLNVPTGSGMLLHPNISTPFYMTIGLLIGHYSRVASQLQARLPRADRNQQRPTGMDRRHVGRPVWAQAPRTAGIV